LPFGKIGVGFGLIPYSSVGYKIESISADVNTNNRRYNGSGLNKAFWIRVSSKFNFSVGADAQYNFGKIETSSLEFISEFLLVLARVTRLIYQVLILMLAQCTKRS
jgi:hypothetical protein